MHKTKSMSRTTYMYKYLIVYYNINSYEVHQYCVMQIKCNYCDIKYAAYLKIAHSYMTSFIGNAVIKFQIYFTLHMCINRHIVGFINEWFHVFIQNHGTTGICLYRKIRL